MAENYTIPFVCQKIMYIRNIVIIITAIHTAYHCHFYTRNFYNFRVRTSVVYNLIIVCISATYPEVDRPWDLH